MPFYILFFIIGLCFGSFFTVCIYRIPIGQSIISPPSHCTKCKKKIIWYDNIPLISYFLLRGKCRFCKNKIEKIYPIVEFLSGCVFLLSFIKFGVNIKLPIYLYLFSSIIICSFIDIKYEIIPDKITLISIPIGIITSYFTIGYRSSLIGTSVGAVVILILILFWKIFFKKEAMGFGDAKLLAMIGSFLGWVASLYVLFLASIIGLIYGIFTGKKKIPFCPFISIATFIFLIINHSLIIQITFASNW